MCDIAGRYLELTEAYLRAEGCAEAYAENEACRICDQRVEERNEPAFDLDDNGECYEKPAHMWCAWLEQNGHAAGDIRAAVVAAKLEAEDWEPLPI